jgi:hypothetical protein
MGVLVCLARRAPEVVTKEELFQEVWDGAFVTEGVLTYVISGLRKALGDDARSPSFIETIPTKGYRLVAPPRFEEASATLQGRELGVPLLASALGLVLGVGLTTWLWMRTGEEPSVPFEDRDWLLVLPFEDGHRTAALEEELARSGLFRVASRGRIEETLRLMRMPEDAELDLPVAREVALRDGAVRAVLTGRAEERDRGLLVSVRVIDPVSGSAVSSRTMLGETEEEVLRSFRGLSAWVRDVLEEELPSFRKAALPRVTTRSLDALELYSQAMAFAEEDKWLPASDLFERAVVEDPPTSGSLIPTAISEGESRALTTRGLSLWRRTFPTASGTSFSGATTRGTYSMTRRPFKRSRS